MRQPPWQRRRPRSRHLRAVTVRRAAAVSLLLCATALLLVDRSQVRTDAVVVAAHDLRPGQVLTAGDVALTEVPAGSALPGTLHEAAAAVGSTVSGAVTEGEAITGTRLLSSRLPAALTGDPRARLVSVRPADPAVTGLLRTGDVVDVVDEDANVLAAGAVVAVPAEPILLAVPETAARRVAAAGLVNALTLVFH
ncbi:SAF domain-containing protein [Gordonia alkaliphila]|uniref:SAF domain-containing protein n=1 Tax=Gordonia alkaliphila TaxID=1053547 RepID=UPI001FF42388|nr:SAF domain-containing protein [Gordonia alkaliphila]MCK0439715.1 SAF domain-containing protein [Gordonia alkaliphila]